MGMAQNHGAPRTDIINVFISIRIQERASACFGNERWVDAYGIARPHRAAAGYGGRTVTFMGGFVGNTNRVTFPSGGVTRTPVSLNVGLKRDDVAIFISVDGSTWLNAGHEIAQ